MDDDQFPISRRQLISLAALAQVSAIAARGAETENADIAIINRDRKWLDLESMAQLEKSFTIDTPIGKSPLIRKLNYKGVPFYYVTRYGDVGSGEIAATDDEQFPGQRSIQLSVTPMTLCLP